MAGDIEFELRTAMVGASYWVFMSCTYHFPVWGFQCLVLHTAPFPVNMVYALFSRRHIRCLVSFGTQEEGQVLIVRAGHIKTA